MILGAAEPRRWALFEEKPAERPLRHWWATLVHVPARLRYKGRA